MSALNLESVIATLDAAALLAERLQRDAVDDADSLTKGKADAARQNRDLLFLADRIEAAASAVRSQYWLVKGHDALIIP